MRLSEAIMLGSTTCKMVALDINTCALGCALNALSVPNRHEVDRWYELCMRWPWMREGDNPNSCVVSNLAMSIATKFDSQVCKGKMTLEQLVDYVRSIEPQCGDCNRFDCTCAKTEAVPESVVVECA